MSWGRMLLGNNVDNKSIYFKRVILDNNGRILWVNLYINSHTIIFQESLKNKSIFTDDGDMNQEFPNY